MKTTIIKCPYCGSNAVLRNGSYVFGDNAVIKHLFVCSRYPACNSYVSAHEHNLQPMGSLADGTLRKKRMQAHQTFDLLWKNGVMKRSEAYQWLRFKLGLRTDQAHISNFSEYMCDCVISECRMALKNNNIRIPNTLPRSERIHTARLCNQGGAIYGNR